MLNLVGNVGGEQLYKPGRHARVVAQDDLGVGVRIAPRAPLPLRKLVQDELGRLWDRHGVHALWARPHDLRRAVPDVDYCAGPAAAGLERAVRLRKDQAVRGLDGRNYQPPNPLAVVARVVRDAGAYDGVLWVLDVRGP